MVFLKASSLLWRNHASLGSLDSMLYVQVSSATVSESKLIEIKCRHRPMEISREEPFEHNTAPFSPLFSPWHCMSLPSKFILRMKTSRRLLIPRLMFLSGLPTAEKPAAKKQFLNSYSPDSNSPSSESGSFSNPLPEPKNDSWAKYKDYLNRTSVLIPIPPQIYRPLPEFLKRSVLLDFPIYRFDEEKDGREALEEERKKNREA